MAAAERVAELVADHLGCDPTEVVVCSTGPIGTRLPTDRVAEGLSRLKMSREGAADAARAIMTTDSRPKEAVARGQGYVVGGMAKGAGMIRPDMATMLAVITTDARLDSATLGRALRRAVDRSFNALDIDRSEEHTSELQSRPHLVCR